MCNCETPRLFISWLSCISCVFLYGNSWKSKLDSVTRTSMVCKLSVCPQIARGDIPMYPADSMWYVSTHCSGFCCLCIYIRLVCLFIFVLGSFSYNVCRSQCMCILMHVIFNALVFQAFICCGACYSFVVVPWTGSAELAMGILLVHSGKRPSWIVWPSNQATQIIHTGCKEQVCQCPLTCPFV